MNDAKYIGLDVHQATISVAVRDCTGKLKLANMKRPSARRGDDRNWVGKPVSGNAVYSGPRNGGVP